jgi:hypothetical protein
MNRALILIYLEELYENKLFTTLTLKCLAIKNNDGPGYKWIDDAKNNHIDQALKELQ